ncbi:acyl-CoA dehydrogenase family protein [Rhizobium sp. EC-SD404]|uniref:acyl-CoA dehydrogenase family protein n=1 Tax=Rhizobium sp. EC-SD404 TaxID=2038389 RepID=UPI0012596A88|nr:acyl-CoA dehydrogenase family protein [Rhizobium sp. EC-SD404]VVT10494.1 Acyl-CoA dehydrogenase, type 2-like protein [Rhizobium sp. EC-SD404]
MALAVQDTEASRFRSAGRDPLEIAKTLIPELKKRAEDSDEQDAFVAENVALLKEVGLVEAGVPAEFGGGGANVEQLAEMLRALAHGCSSTALAFSMHTHQVAVPSWRWRHQQVAAVEPLLRRVASEHIILLSSGGSDWIGGSGTAERVEGGYRIKARKVFTSAAPAGDILMSGALVDEGDGTSSVIHFGIPMKAAEVKIEPTWRALGMRGTGSHDVVVDGLFVADAAIAFKRPAGRWHPVFQIIATVAFPLIYAVYLGVAERARDIAIDIASRKPTTSHALDLAGRMETSLKAAQLAHRFMVETAMRGEASAETVNAVMMGRTLVADKAIEAVELALELAGGTGFYRRAGLERCFRDIQGARFHPLQRGPQAAYAGAMALGLPVDTVF